MARKKLSKEQRQKIYNKYNGHCAYCGCDIDYKDMQVDHIESVYAHKGSDDLSNLNPSCRMCNFYKSSFSLEGFRERLSTILVRERKDFTYRLALKYGLIKENPKEVEFYFERIEMENNDNKT